MLTWDIKPSILVLLMATAEEEHPPAAVLKGPVRGSPESYAKRLGFAAAKSRDGLRETDRPNRVSAAIVTQIRIDPVTLARGYLSAGDTRRVLTIMIREDL